MVVQESSRMQTVPEVFLYLHVRSHVKFQSVFMLFPKILIYEKARSVRSFTTKCELYHGQSSTFLSVTKELRFVLNRLSRLVLH